MAAHNNEFPWMSYYGNYDFFEKRMLEHSKVNEITKINPSLYQIERLDGRTMKVFICECYSFDVAEYIEACEEFGELDAVIISSNWCGYTFDVKRNCMSEQVGVYDISGFMAALNMGNYWQYLTKHEKKQFEKNGWL
jgi:hypothetical protein